MGKELERLSGDVCGISETKSTEVGQFNTVDNHLMVLAGKEAKPYN